MKNDHSSSEIEKHLAEVTKPPPFRVGDMLCFYIAEFGEVFDENKLGHSVLPRFLRWALEGRLQAVVAWSLCRAAPEAADALRAVMRVATSFQPIGHGYGTLTHRKRYGWVADSLFGVKNRNPDHFITPDEAVFLAGVAAYNHELFWQYREKPRYAGQGGEYIGFIRAKLNQMAEKYEGILRTRGFAENLLTVTEASLKKFCKDFGNNCTPNRQRARKIYTREFGKPPEQFTIEDLRLMARPNRFARRYLGSLWRGLTEAEQRRVEEMPELALVAPGEVVDWDAFYAARLSRLLKRKIKAPVKK